MEYEMKKKITTEQRENLNKYSDVLAQLLHNRGYENNESADKFIDVDYDTDTHDPELMKDVDIATDRILGAMKNNERICIFSDYDADGIPGAVVLTDFFKKAEYENFFSYIPHRNKEGFGLNEGAVDRIKDEAAKLIITIDCGITDTIPINRAVDYDMDVIVTDHHNPNGHETKAIATVNPHQPDCKYPDKNLCGAGVIFKLVQALIKKGNASGQFEIKEGWEKWLLDMVGIATLSDMVPLIGENRVLAKYGLVVLRKTPRKGLLRLLRKCGIQPRNIVEEDVGFSISPRINAASRMGEPESAYQMLSTDDEVEADLTVKHLDRINNERKGKVAAMVKEIKKSVMETEDLDNITVVVKGNPNWSPSLLGLAASKIVDTYHCPVFLWGRGEGNDLKGSCRSDGSVNLVDLMNEVADGVIPEFGGHVMAGGFVVSDEGVHTLSEELKGAYEKASTSGTKMKTDMDTTLVISDVNYNLFNDMQKLAPFGVGNPKPTFLFEGITVDVAETFGKEKNHMKLIFDNNGKKVSAIKFFSGDDEKFAAIKSGQQINLVANMEKSTFGRYPELRLRIVDVIDLDK